MHTQTKESQENLTPDKVKQLLIKGNKRFVEQRLEDHQLMEQVRITSTNGQFPHTVILGCVDSRAPAEQIFDQGIGNLFNTRIAGNVVDEDVLGSLEFSCKLAGAMLVVVFGHTSCGAITAACKGQKVGHVTALLDKIQPAVDRVKSTVSDITSKEAINMTSKENVFNSIHEIREKSSILREMEEQGEIKIVGAMYHIESGKVKFYD